MMTHWNYALFVQVGFMSFSKTRSFNEIPRQLSQNHPLLLQHLSLVFNQRDHLPASVPHVSLITSNILTFLQELQKSHQSLLLIMHSSWMLKKTDARFHERHCLNTQSLCIYQEKHLYIYHAEFRSFVVIFSLMLCACKELGRLQSIQVFANTCHCYFELSC